MGLITDRQYVEQLGGRLQGFKWVKADLANCRCEVCGDSSTDATKQRGYWMISTDGTGFTYYCHKGGEDCTRSLRRYLEEFHNDLFTEYVKDSFLENGGSRRTHKPKKASAPVRTTTRKLGSGKSKVATSPILDAMVRVDMLPPDHKCRKFVEGRVIPERFHSLLYYSPDFKLHCFDLCEDDPELKLPSDERLVIPFFDSRGELKAVQGRALDPRAELRYITVKKTSSTTKTYGDERVDPSRVNLVTEGPIDSMFLPNCRATADADLMTITGPNTIYVPDNQYRERSICKRIDKWIEAGAKIVLFPPEMRYKDINDMCHPDKGGLTQRELLQLIADNVYSGLQAKLRFAKLRKC